MEARALFGLCALGALLLGCSPEPERVFVRLAAVPSAEPLPSLAPVPAPPAGVARSSAQLEPMPERQLYLGEYLGRVRQAQELIAENRAATRRRLEERLREAYLADVNRLESERVEALGVERRRELWGAVDRLRVLFEAYAEERYPFVLELANLVGFPDPDPDSDVMRSPRNPERTRQLARAREIRRQILRVDRDYEANKQTLFDQANALVDGKLVALAAELEALRVEAIRRAEEEAIRAVTESAAQDDLRSRTPGSDRRLPEEPGASQVLDEVQPPPRLVLPSVENDATEELETDVQIWARVRGYKLSESPEGARDATEEFIEWHNRLQAGP